MVVPGGGIITAVNTIIGVQEISPIYRDVKKLESQKQTL